MVVMVSRTGRHLQRYNKGRRQVVGCIPYRYKDIIDLSMGDEDAFEVLLISPQRKGKGLLFPKGGWEKDETIEDAARRETIEEAGVCGDVEMSVREARKLCQNGWMKEALELLVSRLTSQSRRTKVDLFSRINCSSGGHGTVLHLGCRAQVLAPPLPNPAEEA
uniref:Nudix hydrolase 18, mitochondrial-like isoform X3 n=1 Tax=Nicotiana sylvestris TaxID=4096 RepID=A0A1U7Y6V1_NICSY|nr:PREDICTED: nudix hydrolase 18, mitochondrial-like isoform X3 [Nicotiana sylvestris]